MRWTLPRLYSIAVTAMIAVLAFPPQPVTAQGLNLASGKPDEAIEVFADDGIEWQQEDEILIARGKARATRGGVTVSGDELRAYYKKKSAGGTDLTRLDAVGSVKIVSNTETATGETAVYDMEKAILVLTGRSVKFTTPETTITADRQLEYIEKTRQAIARGNAVVTRDGKILRADVLVAYLRSDKSGKTRVQRVEAFDNVQIDTVEDKVRADRGVYNVTTGIAILNGRVRINRGKNILQGERAEVNLNTGISNMLGGPGRNSGRVRGLILPRRPDPKPKAQSPQNQGQ
ncbi:MAG: hypothetical protein O3A84_02355 [Proteobacteria bacterium]|nr:hypothetical protein [Pseudomonadota bacterium]